MNRPLTPEEQAQREQEDRDVEAAIREMSADEQAALNTFTTDYSRRRYAMMRKMWRQRGAAWRPSLQACAVVSSVALLILILAWR